MGQGPAPSLSQSAKRRLCYNCQAKAARRRKEPQWQAIGSQLRTDRRTPLRRALSVSLSGTSRRSSGTSRLDRECPGKLQKRCAMELHEAQFCSPAGWRHFLALGDGA
ncbi:unnamed protein product [Durusdinium trenchii]